MGVVKQSFMTHTSMTWVGFKEEVLTHLSDTPKLVQLAYKITSNTGKMSYLNNAVDWDTALTCLCAKVKMVRIHAVRMEIKNIVSFHDLLPKKRL